MQLNSEPTEAAVKETHSRMLATRRRKARNKKLIAKLARQQKKLGAQKLKAGSAQSQAKGT